MQKVSQALKGKKTIAVVPTMGFLHEGHLSLVKIAKKKAAVTIVTLFLNPMQFGPKEDFSTYPRDERADFKKLRALKVDYVFLPSLKKIYPEGFQTTVSVSHLTKPLCGRSRPGHFNGVTTVVNKLFNITQPDYVVFGMKDYQQLLTVKQMVKDLNMPIKVLSGKIIREKDGLAMSSRNANLNKDQRKMACSLHRGLKKVKRACAKKGCHINTMKKVFLSEIPKDSKVVVDYFECLDAKSLAPVKTHKKNSTLIAVAVFFGKTRLIDNMVV